MNIQIHDALILFCKWAIGSMVRGQRVDSASVEIETFGAGTDAEPLILRYTLTVYFMENQPPESDSPETKMLKRVWSEVPHCARVDTEDLEKLRAWLVGLQPIRDWRLNDEH
jgi:hypothetical protein